MSRIIYSKFSNERCRRFAIRTDIVEGDKERFVVKRAVYPEGEAHVKQLPLWNEKLSACYARIPFQANACQLSGDGVRLQYVEGETLEEHLDALLEAGQTEEAARQLKAYLHQIESVYSDEAFFMTEEFKELFGEPELPEGLRCGAVTNIDLVCENLVLTNPPTVLDYEWTFDFPIPCRYVLYRVIHYYTETHTVRKALDSQALFAAFGMTEEERGLYGEMEKRFQQSLTKGHVPMRELYADMCPGIMEMRLIHEEKLQVYFSFGEGCTEENSVRIPIRNSELETEIPLPKGCLDVRIDPGNKPCIAHFARLAFDGKDACLSGVETKDGRMENGWFYIVGGDPAILGIPVPEGAELLNVKLTLYHMPLEAIQQIKPGISAEQQPVTGEIPGEEAGEAPACAGTEAEAPEQAGEAPDQPEENQPETCQREERTEAQAPEEIEKETTDMEKKEEKQRDKKKTEEFQVVLDTCEYREEENGLCVLRGWMYTADQAPTLQVRADYEEIEGNMTRYARPDVLKALPKLPFPDSNAGFEIRIPNLRAVFQNAKTLRVRICCGEENFPLIQKSLEQVKAEYVQDSVRYFMECVERRLDKVYIQGWCISTMGELSMQLLDEDGMLQEEAHWGSMRRPDLPEVFGVEPEKCHGFLVEVPRAKITAKELTLVFDNGYVKKEERIDMRKFDRENTRVHRMAKAVLGKGNRRKSKDILFQQGIRSFLGYLWEESSSFADAYGYYEKKHRASAKELKRQSEEVFSPAPLFSVVVPLYNTPREFLKAMVDSVQKQSYGNWQLCLADGSPDDSIRAFIQENYGTDERICYRHLEENKGISGNTNAAFDMVKGDYVVFTDHDDELSLEAFYENACMIREHPDAELIYSDEDIMDQEGNRIYPHFKPDFNMDFLRCNNYICHLVVVKKSLLDKVGGLNSELDGAQDHDFLLRCAENTEQIYHIPKVLYHWRSHDGSTAGNQGSKSYAVEACRKALEQHYARVGLKATPEYSDVFIFFKTKYQVQGNPKVSVLIPNKDHRADLRTCITSLMENTTWKNLEIIVIENNSEEEETFAYYEELKKQYSNVQVVRYEGSFNYSAINNFGARYATGDYILLLNNDTEALTPDWLERMLGYCQREDVAIAGAKLLYPDKTVQHAGVAIGVGGFAGHILTGYADNYTGYMGRLLASHDVSAVTGACLLVKRDIYEQLGGLDEENFGVALNDVDFCLRARELGKLVVYVAEAKLYHYESKSRGLEITPEKQNRFRKEIRSFQQRHREILEKGDPYYNPNLTLVRGDCSLRSDYEIVRGI